ncbi:MAG: formylglycine-generating enzyme family protein [Pseudomonadota bacterium]
MKLRSVNVPTFTERYQEPWFSGSGVKFCFKNCLQSYIPQPKSDISQLLHTCQQHFNANRLTSGRGGTALDCYSKVLKTDPNNAEALRGLDKIEATYVAWIERALNRDQKKRAERYMASLRLVNPESPKLREFEDRLSEQSFSVGEVFQDPLKDGGKGPMMVWIAAGSFQMGMGSNDGDDDEKPVHRVSITQDFGMGRYEVTFAEYDKFAQATGRKKPDDEGWGRGNRPVINVSWHDAVAYTKWLSQQTSHGRPIPMTL